jgi:hypothetical protein
MFSIMLQNRIYKHKVKGDAKLLSALKGIGYPVAMKGALNA